MSAREVMEYCKSLLAESTAKASSEAGTAPQVSQSGPAPEPVPTPAPAKTKTRQPSEDWSALDKAYQAHHVRCVQCIAAGRGAVYGLRCGVGAALWSHYQACDQ